MRKFVTIIVSFLVLFIFLMLNYLLWDKENLLEQRDSDKIQQDWLRGQNLALQSTIDELEQKIKTLETKSDAQQSNIIELENKLRQAAENESNTTNELNKANEALIVFKSLMAEELKDLTDKWFNDITANRFEDSFGYLDEGFTLWGKKYGKDEYIDFISGIESISVRGGKSDDNKSFIILKEQGDPYEITARIQVAASVRSSFKNLTDNDIMEIVFRYDADLGNWVIRSVSGLNAG